MHDQPKPLPTYLGWPVVIIAIVVFWPVGLVLLSLRLSNDRSSQMVAGGVLMVVGWILAVLSVLIAVVGITTSKTMNGDDVAAYIFFMVVAFGGFLLARKGAALRRKRKMVQHYIAVIVNQGLTGVDEIAVASGRSDFNAVMLEIQGLIKEGFLPGYRLDTEDRRVYRVSAESHVAQEVGFTCRSCGANNLIIATGAFTKCEYCATPIRV